jgi:hypothetical protein
VLRGSFVLTQSRRDPAAATGAIFLCALVSCVEKRDRVHQHSGSVRAVEQIADATNPPRELPMPGPVPLVPCTPGPDSPVNGSILALSANTDAHGAVSSGGWLAWLAPLSPLRFSLVFRTLGADASLGQSYQIGPFHGRPAAIAIAGRGHDALIAWLIARGPSGFEMFVQRVTDSGHRAGFASALLSGEYREWGDSGGVARTLADSLAVVRDGDGFSLLVPGVLGDCNDPTVFSPHSAVCAPVRWLRWRRDEVFERVATIAALKDQSAWLFVSNSHNSVSAIARTASGGVVVVDARGLSFLSNIDPSAYLVGASPQSDLLRVVTAPTAQADARLSLWTALANVPDSGANTVSAAISPVDRCTLRCREGSVELTIGARRGPAAVGPASAFGGTLLSTALTRQWAGQRGQPLAPSGSQPPSPIVQAQWLGNALIALCEDHSVWTQRCEGAGLSAPRPLQPLTPSAPPRTP